MRIEIVGLATSACIGLAAIPQAYAGITCYDRASYSSNFVSAVQQTLSKQGFDPGPADGKWGRQTGRALEAYQRSKGLPGTGEITPASLRALFGESASAEDYGLTRNRGMPSEVFKHECQ